MDLDFATTLIVGTNKKVKNFIENPFITLSQKIADLGSLGQQLSIFLYMKGTSSVLKTNQDLFSGAIVGLKLTIHDILQLIYQEEKQIGRDNLDSLKEYRSFNSIFTKLNY